MDVQIWLMYNSKLDSIFKNLHGFILSLSKMPFEILHHRIPIDDAPDTELPKAKPTNNESYGYSDIS